MKVLIIAIKKLFLSCTNTENTNFQRWYLWIGGGWRKTNSRIGRWKCIESGPMVIYISFVVAQVGETEKISKRLCFILEGLMCSCAESFSTLSLGGFKDSYVKTVENFFIGKSSQ